MNSGLTSMFAKYSSAYARKSGNEDGSYTPLGGKELKNSAYDEIHVYMHDNDYKMEIKKRGGNFFSRAVCWLKDRLFPTLAPFMPVNEAEEERKGQGLDEFTTDLLGALESLGESKPLEHRLIQKIDTARDRYGAVRSGTVYSILSDLATLAKQRNRVDEIPEYAKNAFDDS